jgi:hypothetical protein
MLSSASSTGQTVMPKWVQRLRVEHRDESPDLSNYIPDKNIDYISINPIGWCEFVKIERGTALRAPLRVIPDSRAGANQHVGYLSDAACKKLRKKVNFMVYVSKYKIHVPSFDKDYFKFDINLITLDLPSKQVHSDQFLKRHCLQVFIQYMERHFKMDTYIWKAEAQENGNIHFHITANVFIPYMTIRDVWNRILEKYGYIDAFSRSQKAKFAFGYKFNPEEKYFNKQCQTWLPTHKEVQFARFKKGTAEGWRNPNSTDVHSVKSVSNLAGYLSSYMSKKDLAKRAIDGKIWASSRNLTRNSTSFPISETIARELSSMKSKGARLVFSDSYCKFYLFPERCDGLLPSHICEKWQEFLAIEFPVFRLTG